MCLTGTIKVHWMRYDVLKGIADATDFGMDRWIRFYLTFKMYTRCRELGEQFIAEAVAKGGEKAGEETRRLIHSIALEFGHPELFPMHDEAIVEKALEDIAEVVEHEPLALLGSVPLLRSRPRVEEPAVVDVPQVHARLPWESIDRSLELGFLLSRWHQKVLDANQSLALWLHAPASPPPREIPDYPTRTELLKRPIPVVLPPSLPSPWLLRTPRPIGLPATVSPAVANETILRALNAWIDLAAQMAADATVARSATHLFRKERRTASVAAASPNVNKEDAPKLPAASTKAAPSSPSLTVTKEDPSKLPAASTKAAPSSPSLTVTKEDPSKLPAASTKAAPSSPSPEQRNVVASDHSTPREQLADVTALTAQSTPPPEPVVVAAEIQPKQPMVTEVVSDPSPPPQSGDSAAPSETSVQLHHAMALDAAGAEALLFAVTGKSVHRARHDVDPMSIARQVLDNLLVGCAPPVAAAVNRALASSLNKKGVDLYRPAWSDALCIPVPTARWVLATDALPVDSLLVGGLSSVPNEQQQEALLSHGFRGLPFSSAPLFAGAAPGLRGITAALGFIVPRELCQPESNHKLPLGIEVWDAQCALQGVGVLPPWAGVLPEEKPPPSLPPPQKEEEEPSRWEKLVAPAQAIASLVGLGWGDDEEEEAEAPVTAPQHPSTASPPSSEAEAHRPSDFVWVLPAQVTWTSNANDQLTRPRFVSRAWTNRLPPSPASQPQPATSSPTANNVPSTGAASETDGAPVDGSAAPRRGARLMASIRSMADDISRYPSMSVGDHAPVLSLDPTESSDEADQLQDGSEETRPTVGSLEERFARGQASMYGLPSTGPSVGMAMGLPLFDDLEDGTPRGVGRGGVASLPSPRSAPPPAPAVVVVQEEDGPPSLRVGKTLLHALSKATSAAVERLQRRLHHLPKTGT
jgi:hypothetical protein